MCGSVIGWASAAARPDGSHKAEGSRVKIHQEGFLLSRRMAGHGDWNERLGDACLRFLQLCENHPALRRHWPSRKRSTFGVNRQMRSSWGFAVDAAFLSCPAQRRR
jgi:hypothetical protein